MSLGECAFRLFVYPLPEGYRKQTIAGSNLSYNPANDDFQFTLAAIFFDRSVHHRCRTYDPMEATLFLVPAWNADQTHKPSDACAEQSRSTASGVMHLLYDRLEAAAPGRLTARGGADHLLVNPRVGAYRYESHPLCELDLLDARFGSAARLALEQAPDAADAHIVHGPRRIFDYFSHAVFTSVPYPSWVRLPMPIKGGIVIGPVPPWHDAAERPRSILVAAIFGAAVRVPDAESASRAPGAGRVGSCSKRGFCRTPIGEFRQRLRDRCVAAAGHCAYMAPEAGNDATETYSAADAASTTRASSASFVDDRDRLAPRGRKRRPSARRIADDWPSRAAALLRSSTFCLQPAGDSLTRKGTLDALLLGCVPVFFHQSQVAVSFS